MKSKQHTENTATEDAKLDQERNVSVRGRNRINRNVGLNRIKTSDAQEPMVEEDFLKENKVSPAPESSNCELICRGARPMNRSISLT